MFDLRGVPVLTGEVAEKFIRECEESYKGKGKINFAEEIKEYFKIIEKSRNETNTRNRE